MRLATLFGPEIEEALRNDPEQAVALAEELPAADLAEIIGGLSDELALKWLIKLPADLAAAALEQMESGRRADLFTQLDRARAATLAEQMSADDRVDLFQEIEPDIRTDILDRMPHEESRDVRSLIQYAETSAGGLMTTDYVALSPDMTVEKAVEEVRQSAKRAETVHEVYTIDPNGTLLGAVSLRDLVLARAGQPLSILMNADVRSVAPDRDQREVADLFEKYDLLSLPVVDETRKLLGIVTVDDVVDVLKEEQGHDIQKMGAVRPTEGAYFQTDFLTFLRSRAVWLVVLFCGQTFTVGVLKRYENIVSTVVAVTMFIPLIISSGGNSGNQAASLVIRGMALGEFGPGDAIRILWRELRMGVALGGILAVLGIVMSFIMTDRGGNMALAVGVALVFNVALGSSVGAMMPLLIRRIGFDPAVASGPFIASLLDVLGIVVYVQTAVWMLGL